MNEKMTDVFEHWLQGRINTCVSGLLTRVASLEDEVKYLREFTGARAAEAETLRTLVSCMDTDVTRARDREDLMFDKVRALDLQASGILHMMDGYGKQLNNLNMEAMPVSIARFDALMQEWVGEFDVDPLLDQLKNSLDREDAIANVYGTTEFNDAVKEAVGEMSLEIRVS